MCERTRGNAKVARGSTYRVYARPSIRRISTVALVYGRTCVKIMLPNKIEAMYFTFKLNALYLVSTLFT